MLIRIMACKERKSNVDKMLQDLGVNADVVRDEKYSAIDTLCRVLDSNDAMLIMEDDIELCDGFYNKALDEINKRPDEFIMFYSFGSGEREISCGLPWRFCFVNTQAYYVPEGIGKKIVEFLKTDPRSNKNHERRYDIGMRKILDDEGIKMHVVYPSLVQHLGLSSMINTKTHVPHKTKSFALVNEEK